MKKYVRLLCAVLVAAALCTSLLFTVGADEAEPFVPSVTVTKFGNNSISNGTVIAKSNVEGNRATGITTLNNTNAPYLSMAEGKTDDSYIIGYANQTFSGQPTSSNNFGIVVSTDNSAPFTVVGDGAKGYYVVDFDISTNGDILPGIDLSVVMRRETDLKGYPFSDEVLLGSYVTDTDCWTHLTFVGDIKNNVIKAYVNGVFAGDAGVAVRTANDDQKLYNDTRVVAQGFRIEFTRNNVQVDVKVGDNVMFDNFAHRLFIDDGDDLAAAVASGNLTSWDGYTSGRGGTPLPTVATVDGVEYGNFNKLSSLSTNDLVDLEFLAQPLIPTPLCLNANINTNGMDPANLFTLYGGCEVTSTSGNIIRTAAPFISNVSESYVSTQNALPLLKYAHPNNILSRFVPNNHGVTNGRGMYKISDSYNGTYYINERVYAGAVTNTSDTYNGWYPKGDKITYVRGVDQHIVIDFDVAMYDNNLYTLKTVTRTSSSGSAWGSADDISLNSVYEGNQLGTFVHITLVLSTDTKDATVFVNGAYKKTVVGNISNNTNHFFQALRTGGNSMASVSLANICMREERDSSLTAAIASKSINSWSGNLFDEDYRLPGAASIVAVDGVGYSDEAKLEATLYGNKQTPVVVKVLHPFDNVITVNCDAVIYTYGQQVSFVDAKGNALTPDKNGVIRVDIPYMPVRLESAADIVGGAENQALYNAIKANVKGNLFASLVPSVGNWGAPGYRGSSLITNIDTGDVLYRNYAVLDANGGMNAASTEYVDMKFSVTTPTYSPDRHTYVVVDFDFATDGELSDDVSVLLVPAQGATVTENGLLLKDLGILDGDTAHVTVVYDLTNNYAYAFVNGLFACSVENGAVANNSSYLAGITAITADSFRLSTAGMTSAVCLDNVVIRAFDYAVADDTLIATVDSGNVTEWEESIYNDEYRISKIPTLAIVDGREYGSIDTLNKILAIDTNYVKSVEMKYIPDSAVKVRSEATIETHGLDIALDWNTGLYEFDPGIERYRGTRTGLAYSSTKFVYTTVGTVYTFKTINAENCWNNASVAVWAYKVSRGTELSFDDYDVVFYPYGEKMEPIDSGKYVVDGKLNNVTWMEMIVTSKASYTLTAISEYPVAGPTVSTMIYASRVVAQNITYAATDMFYSANISTDIEFIFYVNREQTETETGKVVMIDGKEYVAFVYKLAPHEIDKVITVSFEVRNGISVFTQKQDICFLDYARTLLEQDLTDKALVVSLLNYANEAHALFDANGEKMSDVTALLEEYGEHLPTYELSEKLDTSALGSVIRSAALRLNSVPEFVFKVARGFRGTITLSYNTLTGPVQYSVYVNTLASEQLITLSGMSAYDVAGDITITVTPHGSDASVVGKYNLATYAHGLEDNAFAVALYTYSSAALAYQTENSVTDPVVPPVA